MSGASLSSAKASEKPTFTAEPSGRLPSRSNRMTSDHGDAGGAECGFIGARILRFQNEHREPLAALEEIAVVGAEQNRKSVGAELVRLGQRQQLDEKARQLHDVIMRAPRDGGCARRL